MKTILETERLFLRKFIIEDSLHFYQLNCDPEVLKFTSDLPFNSQQEADDFATYYLQNHYKSLNTSNDILIGRYAVIRKKDHEWLGWCGLKYHPDLRYVEIGYRFYKKFWGNGYASESTKGCVAYAFEKAKYPFLRAHVHLQNIKSQRVLEKCGMEVHATITYDTQPTYVYHLNNPDYNLSEIMATQTWAVRHPVLRAGRPLEDVYMEADEKASTFHIGMFYKNNIVGVASFMEDTQEQFIGIQSRLRGMAVLPDFRKRGIAELILAKGEALLKERGRTLLWFNARLGALSFYKKLGYEVVGNQFDIPLIGPHYQMKKIL